MRWDGDGGGFCVFVESAGDYQRGSLFLFPGSVSHDDSVEILAS